MLGTNHVLENSQKLPPRVFQPLGASTLAHGWVRTVRTAQNLHNADIQWAEPFGPLKTSTTPTFSGPNAASRPTSWSPNGAFRAD